MHIESISVVGTETCKSTSLENQDSSVLINNSVLGFKGVVVADGLGSHQYSKVGADFCVNNIKNQLESINDLDRVDFELIFKECQNQLKSHVLDNKEKYDVDELDPNSAFGTTLICVLELTNKFIVAYIGNGAIWHIRGNFNHFHKNQFLPWNAINYLNPHSVQLGGKEALYKLFSLSDAHSVVPTVIELNKDRDLGDIVMICTDGLYSFDQVSIGKDSSSGKVWISGETIMVEFFNYLNEFFKLSNKYTSKTLKETTNAFLQKLKENDLLEDDISLGMIISDQVLNHQHQKYHQIEVDQTLI